MVKKKFWEETLMEKDHWVSKIFWELSPSVVQRKFQLFVHEFLLDMSNSGSICNVFGNEIRELRIMLENKENKKFGCCQQMKFIETLLCNSKNINCTMS